MIETNSHLCKQFIECRDRQASDNKSILAYRKKTIEKNTSSVIRMLNVTKGKRTGTASPLKASVYVGFVDAPHVFIALRFY